jgi:hypothetical protein
VFHRALHNVVLVFLSFSFVLYIPSEVRIFASNKFGKTPVFVSMKGFKGNTKSHLEGVVADFIWN